MRGPFKFLFSVCLDTQLSGTKPREEHVMRIRNRLMHATSFTILHCNQPLERLVIGFKGFWKREKDVCAHKVDRAVMRRQWKGRRRPNKQLVAGGHPNTTGSEGTCELGLRAVPQCGWKGHLHHWLDLYKESMVRLTYSVSFNIMRKANPIGPVGTVFCRNIPNSHGVMSSAWH